MIERLSDELNKWLKKLEDFLIELSEKTAVATFFDKTVKHPNKKRLKMIHRRECMKAIMRLKIKDSNLFFGLKRGVMESGLEGKKYIVKYWYLRKGYMEGWDTSYAEFNNLEMAKEFMKDVDLKNEEMFVGKNRLFVEITKEI